MVIILKTLSNHQADYADRFLSLLVKLLQRLAKEHLSGTTRGGSPQGDDQQQALLLLQQQQQQQQNVSSSSSSSSGLGKAAAGAVPSPLPAKKLLPGGAPGVSAAGGPQQPATTLASGPFLTPSLSLSSPS